MGVLILVFMEVILLPQEQINTAIDKWSFNPCFYGSYSFTGLFSYCQLREIVCFNPCFYGSYSFT